MPIDISSVGNAGAGAFYITTASLDAQITCPVKDGTEILRYFADSSMKVEIKPRVEIAFGHHGAAWGQPFRPILTKAIDMTQKIVEIFESL